MSFLSFLRYPFESVVRNKRRSLFSVIGIVIALSLVSGSWIAVDSSGLGLLRAELKTIPVDYVVTSTTGQTQIHEFSESYASTRARAIESVDYVTGVASFAYAPGWKYLNSSGRAWETEWGGNYTGPLMFLSRNYSDLFDAFHLNGSLPERGTVAIPGRVASDLHISVGENITVQLENWQTSIDEWGNYTYVTTYYNVSCKVSQIWTQDKSFMTNGDSYYPPYYSEYDDDGILSIYDQYNPIVFNLADLPSFDENATVFYSGWGPIQEYFVWIDRDKVVDLANLRASLDRLTSIERQINKRGYTYGFSVYSNALYYPIADLIPTLEGVKPLFLALSLPVVALGVYLSLVGVDLGVNERKREIAILKSRGGSNKQVFSSLMVESFVLGTGAGIAGLFLGVLVSRFLLEPATTFSYQVEGESDVSDFLLTSSTVLYSVLFGIALMVLSSYRPFKKVSKTEVKEALHYFSPSIAQIDYKPRTDIILLCLSIVSIVSITVGIGGFTQEGWSWVTQLVINIIIIIGVLIFPLMPFLLSLSVIRLLTRGSRKLYAKLTFIARPFTKDLHYLVDKNIVRNPRRASNLCVIIALALAFGLFISVTMESTIENAKNEIKYEIGSDIRTNVDRGYGTEDQDVPSPNFSNLSTIDGIESYCPYMYVPMYISYFGGGSAVAFDAQAYKDTVEPDDFYFVGGGSEMLNDLAEVNGSVLVESSWADYSGVEEGDVLAVTASWSTYDNYTYYYHTVQFNVLVVGFTKGLPGVGGSSTYIDSSSLAFFSATNISQMVYNYGVLVNLERNADPHAVADEVESDLRGQGFSPYSDLLVDRMDDLSEDPSFRALADFLYMEYVLSIAIMTVGVGLLIFVAVNDREKELACMMARGSSGGQVRRILMGESFTLMTLGLVVGGCVGTLTAYLFNTLIESSSDTVPREMYFTWVSGAIVVASIVALVGASFLATSRAGKIKLAEVLRIRGG